jgi:hypothetical protein
MLRFADFSPTSGKPIQIEYQTAGAAWQILQTVQTGVDGSYAASLVPAASGSIRATFPGDGTHPPITAAEITITVLAQLTMSLSTQRPRRGAKVRVRGTLAPAVNSRVDVVLERRVGRRWLRVQRRSAGVSRGGYTTLVRPTRAGLHRVTVRADGATVRRQLRAR